MTTHIVCLGLSHRTAPLEVREQISYSPKVLKTVLTRFANGEAIGSKDINELVIVSTCNRLEVYACISNDRASEISPSLFAPLFDFLAETRGIDISKFQPYFYYYTGLEAANHLCRVAGGLDSMVVGEPQILGQVAEAVEVAKSQGATSRVLTNLFQTAIRAGKRARTETTISRNPASISSVAVKLAENVVGELEDRHVVIVGAGEMAELAIEALRTRGVQHISVVNRTRQRACELAKRWDGQPLLFEQLAESLHSADIAIISTRAPHTIINTPLVQEVMQQRAERPLLLIDIAVPRNIDSSVSEVPGVYLFDIDQLQQYVESNLASRQREIPLVETIIEQETAAFETWLRQRDMLPVITDLRSKAEEIRRNELDRTLRHLPHLDSETLKHIEHLSESLVNKLLHEPTQRLRVEASAHHAAQYAEMTRHLFGLKESSLINSFEK